MSDHVLKTIEDLEAKATEHEREILKIRSAINSLCEVSGMEPKYQLDNGAQLSSGSSSTSPLRSIRPDQFYGKPQATAVREVLNLLRAAGRAPASVDTIYDVLCQGGFAFETKAKDAAIQGLHISIGKNSALFVKLNNGLIGVTEWYGGAPKARRKKENGGQAGDDQPQTENNEANAAEGGAS